MLITQRPGRLRVLGTDGKLSEPLTGVPPVDARGQGGLLDVALDPAFAKNQTIYWSYAEPREPGVNNTAVAKGTLMDGAVPRVDNVQVIYHQVPSLSSPLHFGSRLIFGRDGTLFVTQGERSITEGRMQAQRLAGCSARSCGSTPTARFPGTTRSWARRACGPRFVAWPSQHPVGRAAPDDRGALGSGARDPRRRRDQHRSQG